MRELGLSFERIKSKWKTSILLGCNNSHKKFFEFQRVIYDVK